MAPRAQALSSRRSVVSFLLGASGGFALGCSRAAKKQPDEAGPTFALRTNERPDPKSGNRLGDAIWLALASAGPRHRKKTIALLQAALAEIEASATPGLDGLFEPEAIELLHARRGLLLPKLTAARAMIRHHWTDAELTVTTAPGGFFAWKATTDRRVEHARFLMWPISHALLLRNVPPPSLLAVQEDLANESDSATTSLALIVTPELALRRGAPAELARLQADCRRARRLLDRVAPKNPLASALADLAGATSEPLIPWIELRANDLLVVPRLGALATRSTWVGEVRKLLTSHGAHSVRLVNA